MALVLLERGGCYRRLLTLNLSVRPPWTLTYGSQASGRESVSETPETGLIRTRQLHDAVPLALPKRNGTPTQTNAPESVLNTQRRWVFGETKVGILIG